jgi:hypothetical protein
MRFRATLMLNGKTATGVVVPDEIVEKLGSKRAKVAVTVNGYTYRSSIASMGGRVLLGLSAEVREGAGVTAGDVIDIDIEADTAPREITVPGDLAEALRAEPAAEGFYDALSYSHQRAYVEWIDSAKRAETRQTRVAKAVEMLRDGHKR